MIKEAGKAIVDASKAVYPTWDVTRFPDDPRTYPVRSSQGTILVSYEGRSWSDPASDLPRHVREIRFAVTVVTRNVADRDAHDGSESALEKLSGTFEGFEAEGFVFYPGAEDYLDFQDGYWYYGLQLTGYKSLRLGVPE